MDVHTLECVSDVAGVFNLAPVHALIAGNHMASARPGAPSDDDLTSHGRALECR